MSDAMWLVVHIPKTAGTSFRCALEKQFGKSQVTWDYGPASKDTSDLVRKHSYGDSPSSGPAVVVKEMSAAGAKVLIGHVPLQKYCEYFDQGNIITFVRDPLVRMCSEFLHRTKNGTFNGSFSDFLDRPGFQNRQSWFLQGLDEQAFVGITEKYSDSLQYINEIFDWKLKPRKKNVAWLKGGYKFAQNLSKTELNKFRELNQPDISLYHSACGKFATNYMAELER